jgi:Domain of unknown function (DUF6438)
MAYRKGAHEPEPPRPEISVASRTRRIVVGLVATLCVGVMAVELISIERHWSSRRPSVSRPPADIPLSDVLPAVPPVAAAVQTLVADAAVDLDATPAPLLAAADAAGPTVAAVPMPLVGKVSLERTQCYGTCPAYTVTIDPNGVVTYVGKSFVRVRGKQVRQIGPQKAHALLEHFARARFMDMRESYREAITDNPTAKVSLLVGVRTKTVIDYPPCHGGADRTFGRATPVELCALEQEIDQVAGTAEWVECKEDDGGRERCEP